ncbi:MAG TPA: hypothetical protein EYP19_04590 [Desulfobacterales bacterium]|nr:hypothetical protein [Desulfobacterales bacterium]
MAKAKYRLYAGDGDGAPAINNVVRVTVPLKVGYNLKKMQEVTASILDRFGCPNCHSGLDIRFDLERNFLVNAKGKLIGIEEMMR